MCEPEEVEVGASPGGAAGGARGPLSPELRTQLQICLISVETLLALGLPLEAHRCAARLERAVGRLVDSLTGNAACGGH
jgi:hypothetical protein